MFKTRNIFFIQIIMRFFDIFVDTFLWHSSIDTIEVQFWKGILIPIRIQLELSDLALNKWSDWRNLPITDLSRYRLNRYFTDIPVYQWCPVWGHNLDPMNPTEKKLLGFWDRESDLAADWLTWAEYSYIIRLHQKLEKKRWSMIKWAIIDVTNKNGSHTASTAVWNLMNWPRK